MSADTGTDTLGHHYIKIPVGDFMTMAQRAKGGGQVERKTHPWPSLIGRIACWALFGGFTLTAAILSFQVWFGDHKVPVGVISWLSYLGTLSYVGALTIQMTVNQRRILAAIEAIDPAGIGRLAAQIEAAEMDRGRLLQRLDRQELLLQALMGEIKASKEAAGDDAFVDELSAREDSGKKVTRMIRPSRPDDGWHKRT